LVLLGTPAVANSNTKFKSFGVGTCLLQWNPTYIVARIFFIRVFDWYHQWLYLNIKLYDDVLLKEIIWIFCFIFGN
jgi:hypothetical protein